MVGILTASRASMMLVAWLVDPEASGVLKFFVDFPKGRLSMKGVMSTPFTHRPSSARTCAQESRNKNTFKKTNPPPEKREGEVQEGNTKRNMYIYIYFPSWRRNISVAQHWISPSLRSPPPIRTPSRPRECGCSTPPEEPPPGYSCRGT